MKKTIIVVLYKQKVEESKTFITLKKTLFTDNQLLKQVELIIYDNSPEEQEINFHLYKNVNLTYKHDGRNLGIATAYNYAWSIAKNNGSEWLLLFDHDTEITSEYLNQVINHNELDESIASVVPKINSEHTMISPVYSNTLRPLQSKRPVEGIQMLPVMAINSGSMIRVSFLNEVGGFNTDFPLDYLDHWLFYEIYEKGYKVFVLNVYLEHELSVMDYNRVSFDRYKSIIDSEIHFYQNYKKELYSSYKAQIAKRFLKQILTVKNKQIAMYSLRKLFSM
ncbi:glycosyl transferase group 2 family protein [Neobacillus bataviensis LMG 21833]|uniref:Glycosyl transferase group 2 family protein n=1 Tax=Neobacillus bataviensis LMG 21833 TaxID=1117379 RepID=K6DFM1_9BACI|nr:glycosyltransferase [Neobacillus bataviensis]EKN71352.1 glycosyl transferase group 2 family protein [Neobacillus bataviensis LMG 21833]